MIFFAIPVLIQLLCVVHAMRHGRNPTWIMVILFLPLLGSAAYFVLEILPGMQGNRHVRTLRAQAMAKIDPEREVRAARGALGLADTVAGRLRLADALVAVGRPAEAVPLYREALARTPGHDPDTEIRLAQALFDAGDAAAALTLLDGVATPGVQGARDRLALLRARVLDAVGRQGEAGRTREARAMLEEVEARMKRLDRTQRAADADMYRWAMDRLGEMRARQA